MKTSSALLFSVLLTCQWHMRKSFGLTPIGALYLLCR